jgi:hypothetical protein
MCQKVFTVVWSDNFSHMFDHSWQDFLTMEPPFIQQCGSHVFPMAWGGSYWYHNIADKEARNVAMSQLMLGSNRLATGGRNTLWFSWKLSGRIFKCFVVGCDRVAQPVIVDIKGRIHGWLLNDGSTVLVGIGDPATPNQPQWTEENRYIETCYILLSALASLFGPFCFLVFGPRNYLQIPRNYLQSSRNYLKNMRYIEGS